MSGYKNDHGEKMQEKKIMVVNQFVNVDSEFDNAIEGRPKQLTDWVHKHVEFALINKKLMTGFNTCFMSNDEVIAKKTSKPSPRFEDKRYKTSGSFTVNHKEEDKGVEKVADISYKINVDRSLKDRDKQVTMTFEVSDRDTTNILDKCVSSIARNVMDTVGSYMPMTDFKDRLSLQQDIDQLVSNSIEDDDYVKEKICPEFQL